MCCHRCRGKGGWKKTAFRSPKAAFCAAISSAVSSRGFEGNGCLTEAVAAIRTSKTDPALYIKASLLQVGWRSEVTGATWCSVSKTGEETRWHAAAQTCKRLARRSRRSKQSAVSCAHQRRRRLSYRRSRAAFLISSSGHKIPRHPCVRADALEIKERVELHSWVLYMMHPTHFPLLSG